MKIKKTKTINKHRRAFIALIVVIFAVLLAITAINMTGNLINPKDNRASEQKSEAEVNANNKKTTIENSSGNTDSTNYTNTQHTSSDIDISYRSESDGSITIVTKLNNYSDGTCSLSIKNGVEIYKKTAPVIYQPDFSSCAGFSVPSGAIDKGKWEITVKVTSKNKTNSNMITAEISNG